MAERPAATELEAAKARVAELEALDAERQRALDVQAALYRIADAASSAEDLTSFYTSIHEIVGSLMRAENFYIALYDEAKGTINFPYYVDTVDLDIPDPARWEPFGVGNASGSTAYVLRTGRPALLTPAAHRKLVDSGEIDQVGVLADGDWLGVPLAAEGRTLGVLVVQGYSATDTYTEEDRDLLSFVGQHVGIALSRVRATDEARHRDAELALVNEIGAALARQLDYEAIVELIGERLNARFEPPSMFIATYDRATGMISFPYETDEGERIHSESFAIGPGLTSRVIRDRVPLRLRTAHEIAELGAILSGTNAESWLGVPILTGDDVLGVIALESLAEDAFDAATERLLATLATSVGAALENARLFGETKRLLAEADERAGELTVINEIGDALARQLDFDAVCELVGERIRSIFSARSISIGLLDEGQERDPLGLRAGGGQPLPIAADGDRHRPDVHRPRVGQPAPPWHQR